MNGAKYLDMLYQEVIQQLKISCGNIFNRYWWVWAHRTLIVKERSLEIFQNRIIALYHYIEWPPRSSDLTLCDYFLWEH